MSFKQLIKNNEIKVKPKVSWLSEPIKEIEIGNNLPNSSPKNNPSKWSYESTDVRKINHIYPSQLSTAKRDNIDLQNWCETLIMFIQFTDKYMTYYFDFPLHLQPLIGAKGVFTTGYDNHGIEEVFWKLNFDI